MSCGIIYVVGHGGMTYAVGNEMPGGRECALYGYCTNKQRLKKRGGGKGGRKWGGKAEPGEQAVQRLSLSNAARAARRRRNGKENKGFFDRESFFMGKGIKFVFGTVGGAYLS